MKDRGWKFFWNLCGFSAIVMGWLSFFWKGNLELGIAYIALGIACAAKADAIHKH